MKHFIQNLQIKDKLIIIIMSTVIFILLLVGSVLIISERYISKQSMANQIITVSRIIADGSTAAISFDDQRVANEVLSALEHKSSVILGCIYDHSQKLFATYARINSESCPEKPKKDSYYFLNESFELYQSIFLDGKFHGTVYIRATLHELNNRLIQFVFLVASMATLAGIAAYFLANRLQTIISKPILDLATVARQISIDANYTTRLPQGTDDEIGTLNRAFNNMLEQLYKRQIARDKAEQALSEREQDLVVTLNSIGDAVIVTDIKGNITRMNPVAEQLTGWSFKDALKQPLKTIFPIVNASTRKPIDNPVEKVIATGKTIFLSNHTTLIAKDGTERQIADSAAPIRNKKNNILGMILVFNDVTEQYHLREAVAKSKRDLQAIMDNSPAVIHVEDIQGCIIFINRQFDKQFHTQRNNVIGKTMHDIFPEDIASQMQSSNKAVLSTGQELEAEEVISQNDGPHTYASIKFPLFNEENSIYAVCSISTDITERIHQEEQLRRSQKMEALGKLTGGIAHDYNNLLGIIMGYAELLNNNLTHEPRLAKYSQDIEHAAVRGSKLTKKLLAFTRHKTSDASVLNINELLSDQRLMLEKTLTARITLTLDLAENLWPTWLDSSDLEDAIINMSINASHAINGNGQLIFRTCNEKLNTIDAQLHHLDEGDYVLLSIIDTGSGMDASTKEKIFDPFFSTKGEKGTGLGLSQVYGFVKRSGGEIKIYSEPGHGSRFTLYFPRCHKPVASQPSINIEKKNLRGSETLLVVDDEPALLELAQNILTTQGYHVFTATDAKQALSVLENKSVDLMISDVIMPNMDGYQLAARVQKKYPNIKIQMASGFADDLHNHIIDNDLHLNILCKPYTSNTLLTHVRKLLDEDKSKDNNHSKTGTKPTLKKKLTGSTILVMDDEEDVRELFALNLQKLGCNILTASNSEETLIHYKKSLNSTQPVDIVILDLNIPGDFGGIEVAAKIRNLDTNARIIVSSGDSGGPEMTHYQEYGFNGALEKTFIQKKIQQVLQKVLSQN